MNAIDIANKIAANIAYNKAFSRYEKKDYHLDGFLNDYFFYQNKMPRTLISFKSKFSSLQGYYYENNSSDKLVVIAHGFHSISDDFLPYIYEFYQNGYSVFSYDATGSGLSNSKSMYGLVIFDVDLDYCLKFIKSNKQFKNKKIYLFGHSMGGYACLANLYRHHNIKAVATVSAPNDGGKLIMEKGNQFAGELANIGQNFIEEKQNTYFEDYLKDNAVRGINRTSCPILIAHSPIDFVVDFVFQSAYSHFKEFTNKNVKFYLATGNNMEHTNILYSHEAVSYQKEIKNQLKALKKEKGKAFNESDIISFFNNVNRVKYSEINHQLFDKVLKVFANAK